MAKKLLTPSNLKTVKFELKGLDEYLENIQKAGNNIEESVKKAIEESAKPIHDDIKQWAEKHKMTGAVLEGVDITDIKQDGNKYYVEVGINTDKSENSWHAVFTEYGTPTQTADPGIRTAFSKNKSKILKIQKEILAQGGVPVDS